MQKQETKNISTSFLPQVRYHPTIQMPDGTPSTTGTRKFHKRKAEAVQPPLNKTDQKNQAVPVCVGTPQTLCAEKLVDKLGQEGDPDSTSDRGAPRPEQVPLGLEVQLDRRVVDEVEVLTRGQRTNPDWFAWRKNRITASLAHSIAHCRFVEGKSKTPPASYLAAVTGKPRPSLTNPTLTSLVTKNDLQPNRTSKYVLIDLLIRSYSDMNLL